MMRGKDIFSKSRRAGDTCVIFICCVYKGEQAKCRASSRRFNREPARAEKKLHLCLMSVNAGSHPFLRQLRLLFAFAERS